MALNPKSSKTSTGYEDIISASQLLQSGPPAVYQLNLKKQQIGTLTQMIIGEINTRKMNKTILLVGETGTGKSTLINAMVNYAMRVKFEDGVWFQIVEDEKRSQTESQTSDVVVYQIYGFEGKTLPYSLTIIDTPGYGDTRGGERDAMVRQRLFDLFRSEGGVQEINAVGLVLKASENRVTDRLKYIFNSVMSLFGKDLENNIVALMTHSDGMLPRNALQALNAAGIKCARNEKEQPVHFLFNNCQAEPRDEETEDVLENAWRQTVKGLEKFTVFLKQAQPQKLKTTKEVLISHIRLTASIHNLQERIKTHDENKKGIESTKLTLKKYKNKLDNDKNFTIDVLEHYKELEHYGGGWSWFGLKFEGVTRCKVCEENCHYPGCTVALGARWCEVMNNGRCKICTGKCSVNDHVKDKERYVTRSRMVKKTEDEVKKTFEINVKEKSELLDILDQKLKQLELEIKQYVDEAFGFVLTLRDSALTVKTLSTQPYLDVLINKLTERDEMEKVQMLKDMASQVDPGNRALLDQTFSEA